MLKEYNKEHCYQYDIRLNNYQSDIIESGLTIEEINNIKISDIVLQFEDKKTCFNEVKKFIEKHEWLGKVSLYPTHIFTARYKNVLCGVVIMDMPNAFSKLLGEETKKIERLISRGACISFSPKNLASKLIMFSIKWMVKHTQYRLFTAYSDVEAKELDTIYQACNFYYLGKKSGASFQYKIENGKWVSDRYFRSRSVYKRLAKQNNIEWKPEYQNGDKVLFDLMDEETKNEIKKLSKEYQNSCEKRKLEPKHKYAYVLGKTNKETKYLRKKFIELNKIEKYPKLRGE